VIAALPRTLLARLRGEAALVGLSVGGVALGVAAVVAIQVLVSSAVAAFEGGVRAVSGPADVVVRGVAGGVADSVVPVVLGTPGVAAAWPRVEADVVLPDRERTFLQVVGLDLAAPRPVPWRGDSIDLAEAWGRPGWAAVPRRLAEARGWSVGDRFEVLYGTRRAELEVGARIDFEGGAGARRVVLDVAQAQALFGETGSIDAVDVVAREGTDPEALVGRLSSRLGPVARVATLAERTRETGALLDAFRLNLTALSLVTLLVGVFLVYAATRASLARRRGEFGLLRAAGATRLQVASLIAGEAAVLGIAGAAVGVPVGWLAARLRVDAVGETLTNVYLLESIERLSLSPSSVGMAVAVGLGGALAGAVVPTATIVRLSPRSLLTPERLDEPAGRTAGVLAWTALGLLVAVGAWYLAAGRGWKPAGFVLALALLVVVPLAAPWAILRATRPLRPRGFGFGQSLKSLAERVGTTSVAVSSLAVAVALLVGVTILVGSFRSALDAWIRSAVAADVYVSPLSWRPDASGGALDPVLADSLEGMPGVRAVDRLRNVTTVVAGRPARVLGVDVSIPGGEVRFPLLAGEREAAFETVRRGRAVLIGEPLARRVGAGPGDTLEIGTPEGPERFVVAGVYAEYDARGGTIAMDLGPFADAFGPGPPTSVAVYLGQEVDPGRFAGRLERRWADLPLRLRRNAEIRADALEVFDQTFAITRLLRGMALLVAACGVALTLLVLVHERRVELALYRALGADRGQVFRFFLGKGVGIAAFALVMGGLAGAGLAWVLVEVVNPAWFGWTIPARWLDPSLPAQAAVVLAVAVLAAIHPALRASRAPAAELGRDPL